MILVTGASGSNGSEIVRRLSRKGAAVRAMIRKPHDGGENELPGVQFVTADFDDAESIRHALEGVERAFLVTNSSERVEAQQLAFVDAARAVGVRHIVYLSQLHAARNSPVRFLRYHAVVEDAIRSSRMAFTHLRPNLYMQSFLGFGPSIVSDGRFFAPVGDARVSIVDVRDIAAVAVAALTESGHERKIYRHHRTGSVDACRDRLPALGSHRQTDHVPGHTGNGDARRVAPLRLSRVAGRWAHRGLRPLPPR
jgi:uncharacterized protein YbjT (DUF2867 family)